MASWKAENSMCPYRIRNISGPVPGFEIFLPRPGNGGTCGTYTIESRLSIAMKQEENL